MEPNNQFSLTDAVELLLFHAENNSATLSVLTSSVATLLAKSEGTNFEDELKDLSEAIAAKREELHAESMKFLTGKE